MNDANDPHTQEPTSSAGLPQPALAAQAMSRLLRPLARLMIDHGLQHPAMVELLKKALVDEALAGYSPTDKSASDTRIALQTGLHRKDVRRLREEPALEEVVAPMVPVAAHVVARWISDPRFLLADKTPMPLARTPRLGDPGKPDFSALVAEVSRDVGARAVLDELVRMGVVGIDAEGLVSLKDTAFVPREGLGDAFHFLAGNVGDHLSTAAFNLSPDRTEPQMLEQSAFSAGLSTEQAQALHQTGRRLWADALQQFLVTATVAEQRSASDDGEKHRVRFGVYFHQVAEDTPQANAGVTLPARRHKRKPSP